MSSGSGSANVSVIATATNTVAATIPVGTDLGGSDTAARSYGLTARPHLPATLSESRNFLDFSHTAGLLPLLPLEFFRHYWQYVAGAFGICASLSARRSPPRRHAFGNGSYRRPLATGRASRASSALGSES